MATSILFTGGARSGKSRHAQAWITARPGPWTYLATARDPGAADPEMAARIARHRAERATGWTTVETVDPVAAIRDLTGGVVVLDCVTLWLTALGERHAWQPAPILAEVDRLADLLRQPPVPVAVVTNEVGSGIVPANALARSFQDLQGWANQRLGDAAHQVVLVVCGQVLMVTDRR